MELNATFIGQALAFLIFVVLCMKFIWPPVMAAIDARRKAIEEGLTAAERSKKDLELAQNRASEELKEAKRQAAEIIEQANRRRTEIIDSAKEEGNQAKEKILADGRAQIEAECSRAKEQLRKRVAELAVAGAEKILQREVCTAVDSRLIDDLAKAL